MKKQFHFQKVDAKVSFPELEGRIIRYWKKSRIFKRSIEQRPKSKKWTFLDGPPFITGLPHYGTLLSSIPKDLFPRFWTMKGYRVRRVWGWDCHGLPAENKVEKKLGIVRKKDIEEKVGVKKFVRECKNYVSEVSSEWEWYVDRVGRWVDFKNAYKTMDKDYMETVMWVFKSMYTKGYIYKGLRVSLFCPHCSTPISNFEVAMDPDNYKDITEKAAIYKYQLRDEKNTYFLAWSTTPWNKIATPALAINPNLRYLKVKQGKEFYILAESTLGILSKIPEYRVIKSIKGKDLVGKKFIPHYVFYSIEKGKRAFEVFGADFVTAEEGTGIVTIAAYGEEDLDLMQKENIQIVLHVDDEGNLKGNVPNWGGMFYLDVNEKVNQDLKQRNLLYKEETYRHSMPHCWRCHTQLFYAPQDAWYVDVQKLKPRMKRTNEKVSWYPKHFKLGRFLKSMEAAPDWCISRSRYWGSPVPVWECECGERFVPSSISELEKVAQVKINDLHKPEIDEVRVRCKNCSRLVSRVPEVLDSWIEAGSASFAERHYPFEGKVKLEDFFPPDFIVEYTGQIRAWFYVLHVISNALFSSRAFKNVVVTGVILGSDGRKMSKNYGNYPDPKEMLTTYGGDALRLYLMGSTVMDGEDILISAEHYKDEVRSFSIILWNVYNFFVTYANSDGWKPEESLKELNHVSILDKWITIRLRELNLKVTKNLESYKTVEAIKAVKDFLDDLSRWYIRRSRDRVGPAVDKQAEKNSFYTTCYFILTEFCKIIAPITPFISEDIYRNLSKKVSVHLENWPAYPKLKEKDRDLILQMQSIREIVELAHAQRKKANIPLRQPLSLLKVTHPVEIPENELLNLVKDELNVERIVWKKGKILRVTLDKKITPYLKEKADTRELLRKVQVERKNKGMSLGQKIVIYNKWVTKDKDLLNYLMKKTLTIKIVKGDFKIKKAS